MEHLVKAGTRKKRPALRVFFLLPAFGRCCPLASAHPANRTRCGSNIAIADHFPSKTFSFKHHLTGEPYLFIQTPLDRRGMASLQSNSTFSFKHHARAKNRHLNLVLQAELYLRTGSYDKPKNTLAINYACAPLDSALAIKAPGAVEPLVY